MTRTFTLWEKVPRTNRSRSKSSWRVTSSINRNISATKHSLRRFCICNLRWDKNGEDIVYLHRRNEIVWFYVDFSILYELLNLLTIKPMMHTNYLWIIFRRMHCPAAFTFKFILGVFNNRYDINLNISNSAIINALFADCIILLSNLQLYLCHFIEFSEN